MKRSLIHLIRDKKRMSNKTKIGIVALILGSFVAGGFALNALDVDAFGWGKFRGADSEEWQAKMGEFKAMTSEEMQEYKEECMEQGDCPYFQMKHKKGFLGMHNEEVNHDVVILDNGVEITITSENPDIIEKLHNLAEKINSLE